MPLEKIETILKIEIPFTWQNFIKFILISILGLIIGYFLTLIKPIALTGLLMFLFVMLLPIFIGFDFFALYQQTHNVPKLLHPKRWQIFFLTLFLSWTVIGWLFALKISITPGQVEVLKVTYK